MNEMHVHLGLGWFLCFTMHTRLPQQQKKDIEGGFITFLRYYFFFFFRKFFEIL